MRIKIVLLLLLCCRCIYAQHCLDSIPFNIESDNRIYFKTYVNGDTIHTYKFLFDTGASTTIINSNNEDLIQRMRFTGSVLNSGASSIERVKITSDDQSLRIGEAEVVGLQFIAIPYPKDFWDGVIGLDFFMNFNLKIDYDTQLLYLYEKNINIAPSEVTGIDIKMIKKVPTLRITVWINGIEYPVCLEIDTGSDRVLDLNTPFVQQKKLMGKLTPFARSTITGTTLTGELLNVFFEKIRFGDYLMPKLPGAFSTITEGVQATKDFDGVMGNNLLQRFNQIWDFKNMKVYFIANNRYYMPFYDFLVKNKNM